VKFIHKGTLNGLPFANTFHALSGNVPLTQANLDALATAAHSAYWNAFVPQFNTTTSLNTTTAIDLTSRTSFTSEQGPTHTGTIVPVTPAANSLAICISWGIQDRYRGGHPRMYLPLAAAAEITVGRTLTPTKVSAIEAGADGYLSSIAAMAVAGTNWTPCAVRYYSQGQLLVAPFIRPISGATVHSRVDSMRRRTGKETA